MLSMLLSRLLGRVLGSTCLREGSEHTDVRGTDTPLRRPVRICDSSLPDNPREAARGSMSSSVATVAEGCQGNALDTVHGEEGNVFEGKPQGTNQRSPCGSVDLIIGATEGNVDGNESDDEKPGLSSTIDGLYPVGVDESERYARGFKM